MSTPAKSESTPLLDMILPRFDFADASGDTLPVLDQLAIRDLAVRLHLSFGTRRYAAAQRHFTDDAERACQCGQPPGRQAITALHARHRADEVAARRRSDNEPIVSTGPDTGA